MPPARVPLPPFILLNVSILHSPVLGLLLLSLADLSSVHYHSEVSGNGCSSASLFLLLTVQSPSCVQLSGTPWAAAARQSSLIFISLSLLKLMSIESMMPSNHLILCHPLLLLPSVFPSISVFSNESVLHIRWPKYWSFSFSIIPSNEYSALISITIDWFDLLAVQGILKILLQHYSLKASVLWHSAFLLSSSHIHT